MRKLKIKSILYKILLMIVIASFIQGFVTIYISYSLTKTALYDQINDSGLKFVESNSQTIEVWLAGKINEIIIYSKCSEVKSMDWNITELYLRNEISTKLDIYDHLFVADTQGNYNTTLKRNAGSISDRAYFSEVMQGKTVLSDPIISKTTGNQMTVIAAPVKNEKGEIIGLVGGSLNLVKLYNFIENSSIDHNDSFSYIVDKNGMIITHPNKSYIMKQNITVESEAVSKSLVEASREILSKNKGFVKYANNEVESLAYFSTIKNTDGWKMIIKIPKEYFQTPLNNASKDLIFIVAVAILLSIGFAVVVSKSISRPIIHLSEVFNKATNGDLNARASYESHDEIGRAAQSFNKMMETISNLTFYDTLTALPNKLMFMDRLQHEISDSDKGGKKLAVIIFDIDKFENINNALGHSAGDKLLKLIASEIQAQLDSDNVACRLGEDRFAILLPNNPHETYAVRTCLKLLDIAKQPWSFDTHSFHITASLGIAFYPNDGDNAEILLKNALSAMLRAKKNGRGTYQLYDSKASMKLLDLIDLDNNMHDALANNEFSLHYQPQVDLTTGSIIGAEALLRWNNPELGAVSPANFIPLAEENGLIIPIGDWVLRTACLQNKQWIDKGYPPIYIAVNISAIQIHRGDFAKKITRILRETQLDPRYLELEITESIAMEDIEAIIDILEELRDLGVRIAIDDFGTGYSSLSYLRRFHINALKIDPTFTRELATNTKDAAIVSTILAIGHNLDLKVVAEGVETEAQLNFLRDKECDAIQGYLYSRPVPAAEFEELLKNPHKL